MFYNITDAYAALGLKPGCSADAVRRAYHRLAKEHHPDIQKDEAAARVFIQNLNAAHEVIRDHLRKNEPQPPRAAQARPGRVAPIKTDVALRLDELIQGTRLKVEVNDPANPNGRESIDLVVPPETAPGTRFRVKRQPPFETGSVTVRVKARPDGRFKARGSDLRCDVRISAARATSGGQEMIRSLGGSALRVMIPARIASGSVIRIDGEGLPKTRGGRGDLLVRVLYRPDVRITRAR